VSGDTLSGGSFAFTDKNFGSGNKTVTTTGVTVNDGNGGANYAIAYTDNTASTITAKAITASGITANDKVFDSTRAATLSGTAVLLGTGAPGSGTTSDGRAYSGDNVNLSGSASGLCANANVGSAKAVTVSGFSLSGLNAANYSVVQPTGLTASITALPVVPSVVPSVVAPFAITRLALNTVFLQASKIEPQALSLSNRITVTQRFSSDSVANLIAAGADLSTALPPTACGPADLSICGPADRVAMGTTLQILDSGIRLEPDFF
jgi:hypothetical protein